ncbi:MAG: UDP-N-acetylmuramoyl-L-alanine--D-glutamate ligase, partial [Pseudomonadales bacterium]
SFQLERMAGRRFESAVVLNVTEDHMDRHGSMAAYAAAKRRIFTNVGRAVANRQDPLTLPDAPVADLVTFGDDAPEEGHWGLDRQHGELMLMWGKRPVMRQADLPLPGLHNALNVLAAFALVAGNDVAPARLAAAVVGFRALAHRCQTVAEVRGVTFIDDSKATNVGAVLAALGGLGPQYSADRPRLLLVAGGDGKGADFSPLAEPVQRYVKAVLLIGRDAPLLEQALSGTVPLERAADMAQAVAAAMRRAEHGDVVLLSPACASLDMFRNYAERGDVFRAAAEALQ